MSSEELDPEIIRNAKQAKMICDGILDDDPENYQNESDDEVMEIITEEQRLSEQVFSIPLDNRTMKDFGLWSTNLKEFGSGDVREILKEVLKYLDRADLLRTSLLNKNWNFFSREVIRENKNCLAKIGRQYSCYNWKLLNTTLAMSETVPFNGISVAVSGHDHRCAFHGDLSELMSNILTKINMKYLSIDCMHKSTCNSLKCIRKIMADKANSLQGLRLNKSPYFIKRFSDFIGLNLAGQWLPNVRILEFPFELEGSDVPLSVIKELVEAAPKLQKLYGKMNTECLDFILPLKLAKTVKEFCLIPKINSLKNCSAFAMENPMLEKFWFSSFDEDDDATMFSEWRESCQNEVSGIVKQLLKSSKDSLKKVALGHSDLILLTHRWNIPALEKATHLSLMYSDGVDNVEEFSTLRKVEWSKYFPNLKEVYVADQMYEDLVLENDFYLGDTFRESNTQFVCESVTKFCWMWSDGFRDSRKLHMFKNIFPNVKEFYLRQCEQFVPFLNELWTAWTDLEAIYMSFCIGPPCSNDDSVFLGISKEEATYLLENNDDVESLEIVSTKPSIFNLPKLKKLVMHLMHDEKVCPDTMATSDSQSVFLSRLTGQCAFSRLPGLVVEINRDLCKPHHACELEISHIKPFVKFVEGNCDDFGVWF